MHVFYLLFEVDQQSLAKFLPQLLEVSNCEVYVLMLWAAKRTFQGVDIAMFELFCEHSPACALLEFFIEEATIFEGKSFE